MICGICLTNKADMSAIIDGVYHKYVCSTCNAKANVVSSGHARWTRSIDSEDREADIQQPYNADGSINVRFAKMHPVQAQALFSKEDIEKADRK